MQVEYIEFISFGKLTGKSWRFLRCVDRICRGGCLKDASEPTRYIQVYGQGLSGGHWTTTDSWGAWDTEESCVLPQEHERKLGLSARPGLLPQPCVASPNRSKRVVIPTFCSCDQ